MAIDGYVYFQPYGGGFLESESQVDASHNDQGVWKHSNFKWSDARSFKGTNGFGGLFEIDDFSFGIENTLSIGSQSSGSGAGKVTFNAFSITRKNDVATPTFFAMNCSGTPFQTVAVGIRKSAGGDTSGQMYLGFLFKLVAVKSMNFAYADEGGTETIEFEYGGLQVAYSVQEPNGKLKGAIVNGWNRVKNIRDDTNVDIK